MKIIKACTLAVLILGVGATRGPAATIDLFDWAINLDGTIYSSSASLPGSVNSAGFDFATGLGTVTITFSPGAAGAYFVGAFVDHEIDEAVNTFFNEVGASFGAPYAGLSWEIDEPGYVSGDIYDNFVAGTLDNDIFDGTSATPDDVSMALGYSFLLAGNEHAVLTYALSTTAPGSGFYLAQTDPESPESPSSVYFSGGISIVEEGTLPVPEPGTLLLLGSGLAGLVGFGRRKMAKK